MSDVRDHSGRVRNVQGPYSQYNTPLAFENAGVVGTSSEKGKAGPDAGNIPPLGPSEDDEAQLNSELINAWTQRLQVLTVATTFLASMDGELFSLTALNTQIGIPITTTARELVYSCLAGALIFHICASMLGFIGSFALVRYRIIESPGDDAKVGNMPHMGFGVAQSMQPFSRKFVCELVRPLDWLVNLLQPREGFRFLSVLARPSPSPPMVLLRRCYITTLFLAGTGFVLALTGILSYVWAGLRLPVGIFSTVCVAIGIGAGVWAIAR